jgi:hypothetical protein
VVALILKGASRDDCPAEMAFRDNTRRPVAMQSPLPTGAAVHAIKCTGWVVEACGYGDRRRANVVGAEDGNSPAITHGTACDTDAPPQKRLASKGINRNHGETTVAVQQSTPVGI